MIAAEHKMAMPINRLIFLNLPVRKIFIIKITGVINADLSGIKTPTEHVPPAICFNCPKRHDLKQKFDPNIWEVDLIQNDGCVIW